MSNLFKKLKEQKSQSEAQREEKNAIFGAPRLQKNRVAAATDVMGIFDRYFKPTEGNIHVETVLFSAAWLAGTNLFRSFGYPENPELGTVVLSEKANEEWPKLMILFMTYVQDYGVKLNPDQLVIEFSDEHKPQKTILEIQELLQDGYQAVMKKHGLDFVDGARAGIIVCSMLFSHHCVDRKEIDIKLGAGIISMGLVEGAKTSPIPLNPEKAMNWL